MQLDLGLSGGGGGIFQQVRPEEMLEHCLAKPGAWADNPWGREWPVVKVHDKIFAFVGGEGVGVKAGPTREVADEWLDRFPDDARVMAYIGRSGWNDLSFRGQIPEDELLEAVDDSYQLIVAGIPKKRRPKGWDAPPAAEGEPETDDDQ